jgi:hypothetical protein
VLASAVRCSERNSDKERLEALVGGGEWAPLGTTSPGEGSEERQEHPSEDDETPADAGASENAPGRIRTCDLSLRRRDQEVDDQPPDQGILF